MSASNFFKRFRKGKNIEQRGMVVAEWVSDRMSHLPHVKAGEHRIFAEYLAHCNNEAQKFCGRDLEEGWSMHEDWFKYLVAQSSNHPHLGTFFHILGWDLEFYRNPYWTDTTSTLDVGTAKHPVKLLMRSSGHFPEGSKWKNRKSGKVWKLLYEWKGGYLMEPVGFRYDFEMVRTGRALNKNFEKVDYCE